jgi:uncharacterized phage protein (TIGR01671 family)
MKREIKFRDWDPETKEMRYFDLDEYDREVHNAYGNIMQYTGLKDKNGNDIYEGDIVDLSHQCWNYKFEIKYDEKLACFTLESLEKFKGTRKPFLYILKEQSLTYKVIGNIYENPELLGGEND